MFAFLLTLLMAQGILSLPGETGTVSGVVRTSAGTPAVGVRVSAMVPPDATTEVASASSLSALAQTDDEGRYRLEGIPVGRYYIIAGRVDLPTFYPGTSDMNMARVFSITPGGAVSGIDFVMMDSSVRTAAPFDSFGLGGVIFSSAPIVIPASVTVEGGAKLPVSASGGFTGVRFTDIGTGGQATQRLKNSFLLNLTVSNGASAFEVRVENLPEGYIVKSMTYGTTDVLKNPLRLPAGLSARPALLSITSPTGLIPNPLPSVMPAGQTVPELKITLSTVPLPPVQGVRVTGRSKDADPRALFLSGNSGTLYSDGTFEFRGVLPGRHSIAAIGTSTLPALGASIVVGDKDLEGVDLGSAAILPNDINTPKAPASPGNLAPGTVLPLANFFGRMVEEASGKPIEEGTIRLIGRTSTVASFGPGGEFEFKQLLPGTYDLEVKIFGHENVSQTIVVGEEDIRMDVKSLKLY